MVEPVIFAINVGLETAGNTAPYRCEKATSHNATVIHIGSRRKFGVVLESTSGARKHEWCSKARVVLESTANGGGRTPCPML